MAHNDPARLGSEDDRRNGTTCGGSLEPEVFNKAAMMHKTMTGHCVDAFGGLTTTALIFWCILPLYFRSLR